VRPRNLPRRSTRLRRRTNMAPVSFKFLGREVGSTLAGLMVALRIRHPTPKAMPMLAVRKPRSASSARRRRNSAPPMRRRNIGFAEKRRKPRMKTHQAAPEPSQMHDIPAATVTSFDTCPSCGLQAPESLLAEHFLGSPSHKDGPPKIVKAETVKTEASDDAKEEDSNQSVRNLLQMLIPPRAFGRRHDHRSMGPISSIVKDLSPPHRHLP